MNKILDEIKGEVNKLLSGDYNFADVNLDKIKQENLALEAKIEELNNKLNLALLNKKIEEVEKDSE